MSLLEKAIESRVCTWAKTNGFLHVKVRFIEDGWPDRLFISPAGHTIFIEFKRPGETPTKLQLHRLGILQGRGVPAYWTDNELTAINILKAALEPSPVSRERDALAPKSSERGPFPRPWIGEDFYSPRDVQNPEGKEASPEDADHRAPEADV